MHAHIEPTTEHSKQRTLTLTVMFAAGLAGMVAGGPLWGFLGTAFVLLGVGWTCHCLQYHQVTREIEKLYAARIPLTVPVHAAVRETVPKREREFAFQPVGELESAGS
jgi:hypothetical protein